MAAGKEVKLQLLYELPSRGPLLHSAEITPQHPTSGSLPRIIRVYHIDKVALLVNGCDDLVGGSDVNVPTGIRIGLAMEVGTGSRDDVSFSHSQGGVVV